MDRRDRRARLVQAAQPRYQANRACTDTSSPPAINCRLAVRAGGVIVTVFRPSRRGSAEIDRTADARAIDIAQGQIDRQGHLALLGEADELIRLKSGQHSAELCCRSG